MPRQPFPATLSQSSLFFAEAQSPNEGSYNQAIAIDVRGPVSDAALTAAVHRAYRAVPALRLRMGIDEWDGGIVSRLHDELPEVELYDIDGARPSSISAAVDSLTRKGIDADEGELARFAVLRTGRERARLAVVFHHLIADGLCHRTLAERVVRCVFGDVPADDGAGYAAEVGRIRDREERARIELRAACFDRLPEDVLSRRRLPCSADRPAGYGGRIAVSVGLERTEALRESARRLGTTIFKVLIGAVHVALAAAGGDVTILCAAASQRSRGGAAGSVPGSTNPTVGSFVNLVPLIAACRPGDCATGIAVREGTGWQRDLRRRDFPFAELARRVDPAGSATARLESVMVGFRTEPPVLEWRSGQVDCRAVLDQPFPTPKTEISCRPADRGDTLECEIQWGRNLAEGAGELFAAEFERALSGEP